MRRISLTLPIAGVLAAGALAACGEDSASADGRIDVVAAFYPLAFAAERVGGDDVAVANLTPAGGEPHDLELSPSDIAAIEEADYVVYFEGFIPALDDAIAEYASDKALDVSATVDLIDYDETEALEDDHGHDDHAEEGHDDDHAEEDHAEDEAGHDHGAAEGADPHIWLDPTRYSQVAEAIAEGLSEVDPGSAENYTAGAEAFTADLTELDQEFTEGLADRASDDIVTSHAAFGYLADRYGLNQVAISGLSPDQEAGSQRMAEVAEFVEANEVTTIFFETLVSSDVADAVAAETGARTATLDPIEGLTAEQSEAGDDYFTIMRENLAALQAALGTA
ncbi:metal ABC transporter substrate-binding protein [Glycomyces halotolerans]